MKKIRMELDHVNGFSAGAFALAFCLCGCGTVGKSSGGAGESAKDPNDGLYRIETPKGCPGVLEEKYLVIDISGGQAAPTWPVEYVNKTPAGGWGDEYKTDKIVLRKVNAGSYFRQRCSAEEAWNGRAKNPPCENYVGKSFYIGVFEITQRQYEHVTGMKPSKHAPAEGWEKLPVENVSYEDIRGGYTGTLYPESNAVDAQSFMGILRQKTGLKDLDLPTENIWEYCCTAGGANIELKKLDPYARFSHYPEIKEVSKSPVIVGSYKPNDLGLYDMQGNVHEWCLDRMTELPSGDAFGCMRVVKGGHYEALPALCHPSIAYGELASFGNDGVGFRICRY